MLLLASAFAAADTPAPELLLKDGRVDDAISSLNARLAQSAQDAQAYNLLGRAYYAIGKWDEAIRAGEKAAALAPNNAEYHLWLGRAYGLKAENCNAVFCAPSMARKMRGEFERAVQLNSEDVHLRTDLAEFYIDAPSIVGGGTDKAKREVETIAKRDAATGHWIQARLAEKEGNFDLAEQEFKAAITASDGRSNNWLSLASFYRRRGRLTEMEDAITNAVNAQKKSTNLFFDAGKLLVRAGRNLPQAAQLLAKYLAGKEKSEDAPAFEAHYLLGQIREKQGNKDEAKKEYQAALALAKDYKQAREALARLDK
jgi:tetratricopeptide (TPR) repeat protein